MHDQVVAANDVQALVGAGQWQAARVVGIPAEQVYQVQRGVADGDAVLGDKVGEQQLVHPVVAGITDLGHPVDGVLEVILDVLVGMRGVVHRLPGRVLLRALHDVV